MEALHQRNAARLAALIDAHGWPGRSRVGEEGAQAAWLILQHAIGNPPLMRRGLTLLRGGVSEGEVSPLEVAMLEDRIQIGRASCREGGGMPLGGGGWD